LLCRRWSRGGCSDRGPTGSSASRGDWGTGGRASIEALVGVRSIAAETLPGSVRVLRVPTPPARAFAIPHPGHRTEAVNQLPPARERVLGAAGMRQHPDSHRDSHRSSSGPVASSASAPSLVARASGITLFVCWAGALEATAFPRE
jgi:hypothetical protein